jgi:toxin ParE1/3/4
MMQRNTPPRVQNPTPMSAPEYQLILTPPAKQDFRDLVSYTQQTWGKAQSEEYGNKINNALLAIMANPHSGRKRHGRIVYKAGRHQIYYRVRDTEIWILRILHERMEAVRHLGETE